MVSPRRLSIGTTLLLTAGALSATSNVKDDVNNSPEVPWLGWGANAMNNRWAATNRHISSSNIASLSTHCQIAMPGGVSATPTMLERIAYFPSWNGSFYALDYTTCAVKWMINVTRVIHDFAPVDEQVGVVTIQASRTSAQIDLINRVLYFGTQTHALVVAADLDSGAVLATKRLHTHPLAILTSSPTLHNGVLYVGIASASENVGLLPPGTFSFPPFSGAAAAVRFTRGGGKGAFALLWEVLMLPPDNPAETGNWSGVGVWGSSPPIDRARNQVVFATGNILRTPDAYKACATSSGNNTWGYGACFPDRVWEESVLAVDLHSGHVNWVRKLNFLYAWDVMCGNSSSGISMSDSGVISARQGPRIARRDLKLCRKSPGWDVDFGMAPAFSPGAGPESRDILTVGQKNGFVYTLDPETGEVLIANMAGPESNLGGGGVSWGLAADDRAAYFTEINYDAVEWQPPPANKTTIHGAAFCAADLRTGEILWETPVPNNHTSNVSPSVVGDLVLAGNGNRTAGAEEPGNFVVLKKDTGEVLLNMKLDNFFQGGIAVHKEYIMFGTGYRKTPGSLYVLKVA